MTSIPVDVSCAWTPGPEWIRLKRDLEAAGVQLPVQADPEFPPAAERRFLFTVSGNTGRPCWGSLGLFRYSRIVRWRCVIRLVRVPGSVPSSCVDRIAQAIVEFAQTSRALRLHVELHEPDSTHFAALREALLAHGLSRVSDPRAYVHTVLVDLSPPEDELLASFHATCRRAIRAPAKHGLSCRSIADPALAPRMNDLVRETMQRTGGVFQESNWPALMRFCSTKPHAAQLMGVFRPGLEDASALVGFVMGVRHGNTVEYDIAASARLPDLKVPLLYLPTWETMRWAKRAGARWFDFGGITEGSSGSSDPTGGISDFKRYFSPQVRSIGDELVYVAAPRLNAMERMASSVGSRARQLIRRRK